MELPQYQQTATSSNPNMKTLFLTLAASIASGVALHYIARKALTTVIWLFDITLTTDQRLLMHELGFPTFLVGMVLGGLVFWRFRLQRL
jgi:hypothetical protein